MGRSFWLRKMANLAKQYNARGLRAKRDLAKESRLSQSGQGGKKKEDK